MTQATRKLSRLLSLAPNTNSDRRPFYCYSPVCYSSYCQEEVRIFKTKWFERFVRREGIADKSLREAIERVESGLTTLISEVGSSNSASPARGEDDQVGIA